jgi:hypothetical protein
MRLDLMRFSAHAIELRCFTEADAALLQPKLQELGFDVTRDRNDPHTLFLHAPKILARGFTTADQVLAQPAAPQRRLIET